MKFARATILAGWEGLIKRILPVKYQVMVGKSGVGATPFCPRTLILISWSQLWPVTPILTFNTFLFFMLAMDKLSFLEIFLREGVYSCSNLLVPFSFFPRLGAALGEQRQPDSSLAWKMPLQGKLELKSSYAGLFLGTEELSIQADLSHRNTIFQVSRWKMFLVDGVDFLHWQFLLGEKQFSQ